MGARMQDGADLFGIVLCFIAVASLTVATLMVRGPPRGQYFDDYRSANVGWLGVIGCAGAALEHKVVLWSPKLVLAFHIRS